MMTLSTTVMNNALYQVMIGCDWHLSIPPLPAVPLPHFVCFQIRGYTFSPSNENFASKTSSEGNYLVHRGHDIGMFIPHVASNTLIPLIMLGSGSILEFGSFTVKVENKTPAVAFPLGYVTMNLNCADPVAGASINAQLSITRVKAGFKIPGDLLASMLSIAFDMAVGKIFEFLGKGVAKVMGPIFNRLAGKLMSNPSIASMVGALSERGSAALNRAAQALLRNYPDRLLSNSDQVYTRVLNSFMNSDATEAISRRISDQMVDQLVVGGGPGADAPWVLNNSTGLGNAKDNALDYWADHFNSADSVN